MRCSWLAMLVSLAPIYAIAAQPTPPAREAELSIKNEVQRSIDRGLAWLEKNQNTNGTWSTGDQPSLTALALLAVEGNPSRREGAAPSFVRRGYAYLERCVQPDGSIYDKKEYLTHNTALSLLAFAAARNEKYQPIIRKGRAFLIGLQGDFGEAGKTDNVFDGGVGYGSKYEHSDMANTLSALEAMYYTREAMKDKSAGTEKDLNWAAAIEFLQNCQNQSSHNKQPWVSDAPENKGGFVYYPGHSMAGGETNAAGRVSLRSYGSSSYAGLLSYIYADLKRDDPRVKGVYEWLQQNYTLAENPGMGEQGLYYYYHTMAKALSILDVKEIKLADGKTVNWRKELALKLINLQGGDGSWANDNGRWWEKDPALVTAYSIIALERIYRGL